MDPVSITLLVLFHCMDFALSQYVKYGSHVGGGIRQIGINTVATCLNACRGTCLAVDFNFDGNSCWFHTVDSICNPLRSKESCVHYDFVTCTEGYHGFGAMQLPGTFTPASCIDACSGLCEAVDFDRRTNTCWSHSAETSCSELAVKGFCVHFKKVNCNEAVTVSTTPAVTILERFPGQHALGGTFHSLQSSESACAEVCLKLPTCIGVDYTSSGHCWWHEESTACSTLSVKFSCTHLRIRDCTVVNPDTTCGTSSVRPVFAPRIVGGSIAIPNSWPWQARIVINGTFCGAILISEDQLLTAAHCVIRNPDISTWTVVLGDHTLDANDGTEVTRSVVKITIHGGYTSSENDASPNDIAIMKLSEPVTYGTTISPICIPDSTMVFEPGMECIITGWGRTTEGASTLSNVLMQARVPIVEQSTCVNVYGDIIMSSMICAGFVEGGVDTCQGDSGGPLACKSGSQYFLAGITSFGSGCANPNVPGVYTRVTSFLQWISTYAI